MDRLAIAQHGQRCGFYEPQPLLCLEQLRVYARVHEIGYREEHGSCYRIEQEAKYKERGKLSAAFRPTMSCQVSTVRYDRLMTV
jgi:hypothetical protein